MSLRVLSFASLFPNPEAPYLGLFVKARLAAMAELTDTRVLVPVLWRPGTSPPARSGLYRQQHSQGALSVSYRRFLNVPRYMKGTDAALMAWSLRGAFRRIVEEFRPHVVDAHWAYPDGAAAGHLARAHGLPYTVTVRGDDLNVFLDHPERAPHIRDCLQGAARVIGVCGDLAETARALGVPPDRTVVIPNGVDTALFVPRDRAQARESLGLPPHRKVIVSVGRLSPEKGFELIVEAMSRLAPAEIPVLAIVGGQDGKRSYVEALERRVRELGLGDHVLMPGPAPQDRLALWYSAADLLCLASTREGWPNVLLEAMACGCPVLGARVGGVPEVVADERIGRVSDRTVEAFSEALTSCLATDWDRTAIRAYAESRSWAATARQCIDVLGGIAAESPPRNR